MSSPDSMRAYRLIAAVTLLKPFSNVFLAWGVRQATETLATHPAYLLKAMLDPFAMAGIAMQIVWLLARMSLFSVADLSFVLPVTALGYVISTLLGWSVLHEEVSVSRWAGAVLISLGSALVASSPHRTGLPEAIPE